MFSLVGLRGMIQRTAITRESWPPAARRKSSYDTADSSAHTMSAPSDITITAVFLNILIVQWAKCIDKNDFSNFR